MPRDMCLDHPVGPTTDTARSLAAAPASGRAFSLTRDMWLDAPVGVQHPLTRPGRSSKRCYPTTAAGLQCRHIASTTATD